MIHGDLGPHNSIMNLEALEMRSIIDWEYSGYLPPPPGTRNGVLQGMNISQILRMRNLARKLAATINP